MGFVLTESITPQMGLSMDYLSSLGIHSHVALIDLPVLEMVFLGCSFIHFIQHLHFTSLYFLEMVFLACFCYLFQCGRLYSACNCVCH